MTKARHLHYRVYAGTVSPDWRLRYLRLPRYLVSPQSGPAPPQAGFLLRPQLQYEVHLDKCTQMVGHRRVQQVSLPRLCRKHRKGRQTPYHAQPQMHREQTHSCLLHSHSSSFVSVGCLHLFPGPDPHPLACFLHNPRRQPSHLHPMPSLVCRRCWKLRRLRNSLSMTWLVSSSEVSVRWAQSSRAETEYFPIGIETEGGGVFGVGRGDKSTLTSWWTNAYRRGERSLVMMKNVYGGYWKTKRYDGKVIVNQTARYHL